jgi:hypothetical protein
MSQSIQSFRSGLNKFFSIDVPIRLPSIGKIIACFSILGFACLSFLFGAAVMHFQLPTSQFLFQAFTGGKAWHERGKSVNSTDITEDEKRTEGVSVDKPSKTYDGFTLITTTNGARAVLLDMAGKEVHRWELPFSKAWPRAPHVPSQLSDEQIHWFRCHAFPNGDLLVIYHADGDTPYGYGLIKVDKDSKLLWKYEGRVHHDLDVAPDGTIYTLSQKLERETPGNMDYLPTPYIADSLVVLSADGEKMAEVPIAECFRDSPYADFFSTSIAEHVVPGDRSDVTSPLGTSSILGSKGDLFHVNSIKVLSKELGGKFPLFKAGQVLISLRNIHALAVVDLDKKSVVWAARGMWRLQHDADFLDNGHLLLFDNVGSSRGCRILEYDPVTQAVPWVYRGEGSTQFNALFRGMKQRFKNGNTLIVDPDHGRLLEVTSSKELVWEYHGPRAVTGARRYPADALKFLSAKPR